MIVFKLNQIAMATLALAIPVAWSTDGPSQEKSPGQELKWPETNRERILEDSRSLLKSDPALVQKVDKLLSDRKSVAHTELISIIEQATKLRELLAQTRQNPDGNSLSEFEKRNPGPFSNPVFQLEVGIILAKQNQHDQALVMIEKIDPTHVPNPGILMVYRLICLHQTVDVEKAKNCADLIIANKEKIPLRYQQISESILAELNKQSEQPLHSVARLMADVGRRQQLQQQSGKVFEQEEQIIANLNKVIDQMEKAKKQRSSQSPQNGSPKPSSPNNGQNQSRPSPSGIKATGDVESRQQDSNGQWGSLSDDEREIAVKSMVKELPPHFKSLLQAYFQKLAEEKK